MAKVKNPLFSMNASGTHAGIITFTDKPTGAVAKKWSKPTGIPNGTQTQQRVLYMSGVMAWNALSPSEKAGYEIPATTRKITAFNAFMSEYLLGATPPPAPQPTPLIAPDVDHYAKAFAIAPTGSPVALLKNDFGIVELATWDNSNGLLDHGAPNWLTTIDYMSSALNCNAFGTWNTAEYLLAPGYWIPSTFTELDILQTLNSRSIVAISPDLSTYIYHGLDEDSFDVYYLCDSMNPPELIALPLLDQPTTIVGFSKNGLHFFGTRFNGNEYEVIVWNDKDTYHIIGKPNAALAAYAADTNTDATKICGYAQYNDHQQAFTFNTINEFELIPMPNGATESYAQSMTADGLTICGGADTPDAYLPFIWSVELGLRIIPMPAGYTAFDNVLISADGTTIVINAYFGEIPVPLIYHPSN